MDDLDALISQIPEADRDAFIDRLEPAWKGLWLPLNGMNERPGYRAMKAAWDWAFAADPEGAEFWLEHMTK